MKKHIMLLLFCFLMLIQTVQAIDLFTVNTSIDIFSLKNSTITKELTLHNGSKFTYDLKDQIIINNNIYISINLENITLVNGKKVYVLLYDLIYVDNNSITPANQDKSSVLKAIDTVEIPEMGTNGTKLIPSITGE